MYAIMLGLYADYSRSAVGQICAMWQKIYSGAYANNMNGMHTSVPGNIIACSYLIGGINAFGM